MHPSRRITASNRIGGDLLFDPEMEALFAKCQRLTLREWLEGAEAWLIADTLEKTRGSRTEAARALGIARRTLYKRMAKLGIAPSPDGRARSGSRLRVVAPAPGTARLVRKARKRRRR